MGRTISIVMPAHKEIGNLGGATDYVTREMNLLVKDGKIKDWEIIIIDSLEKDGSHDGTPDLATRLSKENNRVTVIHNGNYVNLGFKYKQGLAAARFDYYMMVPGKNTLQGNSLRNLLFNIPEGGIVIGYQADMSRRPLVRRIVSRAFTMSMNLIFGLKLRYYNGTTVIPMGILRDLKLNTDDFAYMAEILVILLKRYRLPYVEVPFYTKGRRSYGKTTAHNRENIIGVIKTIIRLLKDVELRRR